MHRKVHSFFVCMGEVLGAVCLRCIPRLWFRLFVTSHAKAWAFHYNPAARGAIEYSGAD